MDHHVVLQDLGSVHVNVQRAADIAVGAVGRDEIARPHALLFAGCPVPQHRDNALGILGTAKPFQTPPDGHAAFAAGGLFQKGLEPGLLDVDERPGGERADGFVLAFVRQHADLMGCQRCHHPDGSALGGGCRGLVQRLHRQAG